jgi:hypothetical protein
MPLAEMIVHQLRYYVIFGAHAPARLTHDGHAYLSALEPLIVLAAAIAAGGLAGRLVRAWHGPPPKPGTQRPAARTWLRTWLLCTAVVLGLYCLQETAEGMLAVGHAAGLAGLLGNGGLVAAPLAAALGGVLTLALRGAEQLIELVTRRHRDTYPRRAVLTVLPRLRAPALPDWRLEPACGPTAGRAPPVARASLI